MKAVGKKGKKSVSREEGKERKGEKGWVNQSDQ